MGGRQRPVAEAALGAGSSGSSIPADPADPADADGAPWTRADALLAVGACTIDLLGYLVFTGEAGDHGASLTGFLLVTLSALPLLARRSRPVATLAGVLALQSAADLSAPASPHFGAALVTALYSVARARTVPETAAAAAVTSVLTLLSQSHLRMPAWQAAVSAPVSALLVAGAGLAVARWQREVTANRQLLADRAVADERRRIARELHDIVAHHITTMQLMAGGARANLAHPEVVRDALVTLESSGRLALREMRQLLDVLRAGDEPDTAPPSPQPGAEDLGRLVDESRVAGLPTDFGVHGTRRPLPPTVGLTVFRIVQEGLTNARKYAGPARATVTLTYGPDRVTVEVRDDGGLGEDGALRAGAPPQDPPPPGSRSGYGLIGMRERVALHGGTLRAGPRRDGGFAVVADLPLAPDETADAAVQHGTAAAR
ncbi:sensor histidine kinase [Streptomyces sp. CB01881]|uniref:sensor histidine kinase n=1 Tax=Streptomyces sp. CB01881 TaxID=2078691 RepID=UPI0011E05442|nr:histidine kinase [Streptomyces sp. CB01881]TYC66503.1 sensor histidine kinase [Streptomyces sp. CB01881]